MSRNISREELKTKCTCRLHTTPGHKFSCPTCGEKTNRGVFIKLIAYGFKVACDSHGNHLVEHKVENQWKRFNNMEFKSEKDAFEYLRIRDLLFRKF